MAAPHYTVLVTCVGGRLIYDIIQALRMAEDFTVTLLGCDSDPQAHGRLLVDHFEVIGRAEDDEDVYIDRLIALRNRYGLEAIIALSEGECRTIARQRDRLANAGIRTSVSPWPTVRAMTDKLLMMQRLEERGIETGGYAVVDNEESARVALAALGHPGNRVVLKPRRGAGSRGVMIVDAERREWEALLPNRFCGTGDFDAVRRAMAAEGADFSDLIAVPFHEGQVFDVDCLADAGALTDVACRLRQLRNPLWPTSTGHRVTMDARVIELARQLCVAFGVVGAADFDIVLKDGSHPILFDAGARYSGSVGGSFTAGMNFPAQLVRLMFGQQRWPYAIEDGCVLRPYITMVSIPRANEHDFL